jgi:lactate permease
MWSQIYDPLNNKVLSTMAAALPVAVLLGLIASNVVKAYAAAIIALIVANLVAIFVFTMPAGMALRATALGAVIGFFPIGWIVLNVIFLYRLTSSEGRSRCCKPRSVASPQTAACNCFSLPSHSALSSRVHRASARPSP